MHYCSCNVIQCGKRPSESHEGVGRTKNLPAERTFLVMQKEICGLTAVGVDQVLAENVARGVASTSLAQGGLPTRKRKLRKVCAPESSPKALQVVSLLEVWALWKFDTLWEQATCHSSMVV